VLCVNGHYISLGPMGFDSGQIEVRILRNNILFVLALLITLVIAHIIIGELVLTGDEPRYLYAAVSIWEQGNLLLSSDAWTQWLQSSGFSRNIPAEHGIHPIMHSILISPVVGSLGGLSAGRWVHLFVGIAPLLLILKKYKSYWGLDVYIWMAIFFISIPVLPYLRLLYPEIWLFSILSSILILLADKNLSKTTAWLVFLLAISLPFFHLRMS
jgi:hypothetical protein